MLISLLVFVLVFGGALLGSLLRQRLPKHHQDDDSREVIKLVMGLVATVTALVLGLLIASAHTSYDTQQSEVLQLSANLELTDRILTQYGSEAQPARQLLRRIVALNIDRIWKKEQVAQPPAAGAAFNPDQIFSVVAELVPVTATQRLAQSRALQMLTDMANTRILMSEQASASLSWPFFVVLVFWLVQLFVGFGLFARLHGTVVVALCVGAMSVSGAIFLMLEMNGPYSGLMQISSAPMRATLEQMSR